MQPLIRSDRRSGIRSVDPTGAQPLVGRSFNIGQPSPGFENGKNIGQPTFPNVEQPSVLYSARGAGVLRILAGLVKFRHTHTSCADAMLHSTTATVQVYTRTKARGKALWGRTAGKTDLGQFLYAAHV